MIHPSRLPPYLSLPYKSKIRPQYSAVHGLLARVPANDPVEYTADLYSFP